jgi:hypothetical protein
MSLHDVARGLVLLNGFSVQEAAVRAGVSPGSVAALCERTPQQIETWQRLLGACGAGLSIACREHAWIVSLPRPAGPRIEREWGHWRHRRLVSALNHVNAADPKAKRGEREAKAESYVTNEEARLRERIALLRRELRQLAGDVRVGGLREAMQALAAKVAMKAEELSLLAGVSLGAAQLALGDDQDGRLATLHRLLSALGGRLVVRVADTTIAIGLCPPGDWRPGAPETATTLRASARRRPDGAPNRSSLPNDEILALYDRGLSIGDIARRAGVSRQRVHKLAMDQGRAPRRAQAREQRTREGRETLAISDR